MHRLQTALRFAGLLVLMAGFSLGAANEVDNAALDFDCDDEFGSILSSWVSVRLHTAVSIANEAPSEDQPHARSPSSGHSSSCGLVAAKHVPHPNTVLVRVRPAALLVAPTATKLAAKVSRRLAALRHAGARDESAEEAGGRAAPSELNRYLAAVVRGWGGSVSPTTNGADKIRAPTPLPGLQLKRSYAACLPAHAKTLFETAHDEIDAVWAHLQKAPRRKEGSASPTKWDAAVAWAIVRTRAVDGPTNITKPDRHSTFLAPGLDLANAFVPAGIASTASINDNNKGAPASAAAKIEFQRTESTWVAPDGDYSAADDTETAGTIARPARPTALDVLLTSVRPIRKGEPITLAYGNLRHPLDTVDTYGFLPRRRGPSTTASHDDGNITAAHATATAAVTWDHGLPLQLGFPPSRSRAWPDVFDSRGCRDPAVMTFSAATGKPAGAVVPCLALAHLNLLDKEEASAATRKYLGGGMSKEERRKLSSTAWRSLAHHANRTAVEQYAPAAVNPSAACGVAEHVADAASSAAAEAAARMLHEASAFLFDAYQRLAAEALRMDAKLRQPMASGDEPNASTKPNATEKRSDEKREGSDDL